MRCVELSGKGTLTIAYRKKNKKPASQLPRGVVSSEGHSDSEPRRKVPKLFVFIKNHKSCKNFPPHGMKAEALAKFQFK